MTTTTTPTNTLTSNDVLQKHKDTPITAKPLNRDKGGPDYRMRLEGGMTQKKDPKDLASAAPPTRFVEVIVEDFMKLLGAEGRPSTPSRPTLDLTHLDVGNGAPKNERLTYAALVSDVLSSVPPVDSLIFVTSTERVHQPRPWARESCLQRRVGLACFGYNYFRLASSRPQLLPHPSSGDVAGSRT